MIPKNKAAALRETVFIVDDDLDLRSSLQALVVADGLPCKTFASGEEFLAEFDPRSPGCVVLDVRLGEGMSGVDVYERLVAMQAAIPVVFLTAYATVQLAVSVTKRGAVDVLEKAARAGELGVGTVGETGSVQFIEKFDYSPDEVLDKVHEALVLGRQQREDQALDRLVSDRVLSLTARERQVLTAVLRGDSNARIEHDLMISQGSVEQHRRHCMEKFEATRAQQVAEQLAPMKRQRKVTTIDELWVALLQERLRRLSDEDLRFVEQTWPDDGGGGFDERTDPVDANSADARQHRQRMSRIMDLIGARDLGQMGRWIRQLHDLGGFPD